MVHSVLPDTEAQQTHPSELDCQYLLTIFIAFVTNCFASKIFFFKPLVFQLAPNMFWGEFKISILLINPLIAYCSIGREKIILVETRNVIFLQFHELKSFL